jgi:hypothetical protein
MKFLLFAIPFFSLLLTPLTPSQATPLDHLSSQLREQSNREVCAWEVKNAINTHRTAIESSIKQLHEANDGDGHANIDEYLTEQISKKNNDCGKRLKKVILINKLTSETSKQTEAIKINWEVWEMYQDGKITGEQWLNNFSTFIENKILFR